MLRHSGRVRAGLRTSQVSTSIQNSDGMRPPVCPWQQLYIRLLLLSLFMAKELASIIPSANDEYESVHWENVSRELCKQEGPFECHTPLFPSLAPQEQNYRGEEEKFPQE